MMKQQDRFRSNLQFVSSINTEHEIDANTQTQSVEIENEIVTNILHVDEINAKIRSLKLDH